MSASITHMQTRVFVDGGPSVTDVVTSTVSIPEELFVYRTNDDTFSHLAAIADILAYPSVKTAGHDFYRTDTCTRVSATFTAADEFATLVRGHFRRIVKEWDAAQVFVGTTTETIS